MNDDGPPRTRPGTAHTPTTRKALDVTPDSTAAHGDALLDELAVAYAADPDTLARLLASHAARVLRLDRAAVDADTTDAERAMCAAEADGTRGALLDAIRPDGDLADAPIAVVVPLRFARLAQNGHRA